jgi:hypothetical protein
LVLGSRGQESDPVLLDMWLECNSAAGLVVLELGSVAVLWGTLLEWGFQADAWAGEEAKERVLKAPQLLGIALEVQSGMAWE